MQSGKGGGLTEGFASAENMLGAQTNTFMVNLTTGFAVVFVITSLTLAFLSSKKDRSLMENVNYTAPAVQTEMDDEVDAAENAVEETAQQAMPAVEEMVDQAEQTTEAVQQ